MSSVRPNWIRSGTVLHNMLRRHITGNGLHKMRCTGILTVSDDSANL